VFSNFDGYPVFWNPPRDVLVVLLIEWCSFFYRRAFLIFLWRMNVSNFSDLFWMRSPLHCDGVVMCGGEQKLVIFSRDVWWLSVAELFAFGHCDRCWERVPPMRLPVFVWSPVFGDPFLQIIDDFYSFLETHSNFSLSHKCYVQSMFVFVGLV